MQKLHEAAKRVCRELHHVKGRKKEKKKRKKIRERKDKERGIEEAE